MSNNLTKPTKKFIMDSLYGIAKSKSCLISNIARALKEDVIKVVRLYFYRWRVEEYFRIKKQEYDFENMRLRTLKGMNNLNLMLTIFMEYNRNEGRKDK